MWPPVEAFMWMQQAQSRLQDHHRERVYSSRGIFGGYSAFIRVIRRYLRLIPGPCAMSYSPPYIRNYPQFIHAYSASSE